MPRSSSSFQRQPRFWTRTLAVVSLLTVQTYAGQTTHSWSADDLKYTSSGKPLENELGRRPESLFSEEYVGLLLDDTKAILTSPLRWDRNDWLVAGGLTSLVAVSSALDGQVREESQENRTKTLNDLTKNAQRFGAEGSFVVIGLFEGYGYLAKDQKAKSVAMDSLTSSIIAAGIVAPVLKWTFGRVRPNHATRTFEFRPFSGNQSFPSGHATQAFAVASVIAAHYDQWWVQGLSYGVAGLVGYSRIQQNAHFASDVVAGAVIGTVIGRAVVHRHDRPKEEAFNISPLIDRDVTGLVIEKQF